MTDGIIQKAFNNYWNKNDSSAKAIYELQQELIVSINQAFPMSTYNDEYIRLKLIGDNEE